jgi:hypothetical protein
VLLLAAVGVAESGDDPAAGTGRPEMAGNSPISGMRAKLGVRLAGFDVAALGELLVDNVDGPVAGGSTIRIAGEGVVNDAGVTLPRVADESTTLFDSALAAAGWLLDEAVLDVAPAGADHPGGGD